MIVVTAGHDRERAGRSGQQHIGVAAELASPQVNPLMYGSRLVHMIALVGPATGIEKREVSGDQQRSNDDAETVYGPAKTAHASP